MKGLIGAAASRRGLACLGVALACVASLAYTLSGLVLDQVQAAERASAYHAQWELQSPFGNSVAGERTQLVVAFRNTGWAGWYRRDPNGTARLGTNNPRDHGLYQDWITPTWLRANRLAEQSTDYVGPGQLGWFATDLQAPVGVDQGTYRFYVRPLIENTVWMEDYGVYHEIYVPFSVKETLLPNGIQVTGRADATYKGQGVMTLTPVHDATHPIVLQVATSADGSYNFFFPFSGLAPVGPTSTPTPTPVPSTLSTVAPSATPTPTPTASGTPIPTSSAFPSGTPTPTPTSLPTSVPSATPIPSAVPTNPSVSAPTGAAVPPGLFLTRDSYHIALELQGRLALGDSNPIVPDTLAPVSRGSGLPQSNRVFVVSASYSDVGSGVKTVELWVKRPGDSVYSKTAEQAISNAQRASGTALLTYAPDAGGGTYSLYSVAVDNEGNREPTPTTPDLDVTYDPNAPTATASAPTVTNAASFSVSANYSDDASGVASVSLYVRNPGAAGFGLVATTPVSPASRNGSATWTFTVPTSGGTAVQGKYDFYAQATDAAGNVSANTTPQITTLVDVTSAASSASTTTTSPTRTNNWVFTSAPTDNLDLQNVVLYARPPSAASYTAVQTLGAIGAADNVTFTAYVPAAGDGTYRFYTVANDRAGNLETAPTNPDVAIVLDTTAPTALATSEAANTTIAPWSIDVTYSDATSGVVSVDLYAKKPGESLYTKLNTQTFAASASGMAIFTYTPNPAPDGIYYFFARATDAAGNVSVIPVVAQTQTLFDATAPTASAGGGPASPTNTTSWTFTATASDTVQLASVSLYAKIPSATTYTLVNTQPASGTSVTVTFASYTPTAGDGTYAFYALATDSAGNVQPVPGGAQKSIILDTSAPVSAAAGGPAASPTNSLSWVFTSAPTDGVGLASVTLYVKRPADTAYSSIETKTLTGTSGSVTFTAYVPTQGGGTYAFYTRATDSAGNTEDPPVTQDLSVVLDTTLPTVSGVVLANANATLGTGDTITVTFSEAMDTTTLVTTGSFTNGNFSGFGSFATAGTNAGTFTVAWNGPKTVATVTLTVATGTTAPSGNFSVVTTAKDVAGNAIGTNATAPTGGF